MAAYSRPDVDYIMALTGVNMGMLGVSEGEFRSSLDLLLPGAEAETTARVTQARFESNALEDFEAQLLQDAVSFRTAGRALRPQATRRAGGTHHPTWQVSSEELRTERLEAFAEARKLEGLFIGGTERAKVLARPRG